MKSITQETVEDGRSARWTVHRAQRRRELLRAARAVIHELGPDVTMDRIAERSKISKPIFYRYFTDRAGLQQAVGEWAGNAIRKGLTDASRSHRDPKERLKAMVVSFATVAAQSPSIYAFAVRSGNFDSEPDARPTLIADISELLVRAVSERAVSERAVPGRTGQAADAVVVDAAGEDVEDIDLVWASGAVGFVRSSVEWWLTSSTDHSPTGTDQLATRVTDWLWRSRKED